MVSIDGNVFITSGSISGDTITGGTTVKVDTRQLEDDFNAQEGIKELNQPVPPKQKNDQAPSSSQINLKQIKNVVTITGVLSDESSESAYTKKKNLLILKGMGGFADHSLVSGEAAFGNTITAVWGLNANSNQQKVTGHIVKLKVKEIFGTTYSDGAATIKIPIVGYEVTIQIAVGTARG